MIRASRPGWLAYLFAAPIVALMTSALINDPGRVGTRSSAAGESMVALGVVAYLLTVLLALTWCFSTFRHATVVVVVQVAVVWAGALLYSHEVRVDTTWWDVAEDAFLLATTLAQLFPGSRPRTGSPSRRPVETTT